MNWEGGSGGRGRVSFLRGCVLFKVEERNGNRFGGEYRVKGKIFIR